MQINTKLSPASCAELVRRVEATADPLQAEAKCYIAIEWLMYNDNLTMEQFEELQKRLERVLQVKCGYDYIP